MSRPTRTNAQGMPGHGQADSLAQIVLLGHGKASQDTLSANAPPLMTRLEADDVWFAYKDQVVFEGLSLSVGRGLTFVVGENGVGKTTLFRLILGQIRGSGSIRIDGEADSASPIGYLPQRFALPTSLTPREFVEYMAWVKGVERGLLAEVAEESLRLVNLSGRADNRIGTLSGGMMRRVGVAQSLAAGSDMVLLDEPTVGLDPIQRAEVRAVLKKLGESKTVLVSTNLMADIVETDQVIVLGKGRAMFCGPAERMRAEFGSPGMALEDVFVAMHRQPK